MTAVNFDGCAVGLVDLQGTPFLKKWRVARTNENLARNLSDCRCKRDTDFKHAPITGSNTIQAQQQDTQKLRVRFFSLCEAAICVVAQEHMEKEPREQAYRGPLFIETVDTICVSCRAW